MTRPTQALINTAALRHNLERVREAAPQSLVMAVIKANGYGHGIVKVAEALQDADGFAVASLDEAQLLRSSGIRKPIVLLEGMFEANELERIRMHMLQPVIHAAYQLDMLDELAANNPLGSKLTVWLKIDTGMHRLGFLPEQVNDVLQRLKANRTITEVIMMTHLANADDKSDDTTARQLACFKKIRQADLKSSIANSAGILQWPESHTDYVRPGIMLYGVSPFTDGSSGKDYQLQPVMTLCSRLISVNRFGKGDRIGYGGEWTCAKDTIVGVVAIGYGDGYPRHAPSGTPVLINGQRASLIGRVSMDMITVDLSQQPGAKAGDEVILWGEGLPVEEVAASAATIAYDLLCGVTSRVQFVETT